MSIELVPKENNCFNFLWKIKNFSYSSESFTSPKFTCHGVLCSLGIKLEIEECQLLFFPISGSQIPPGRYELSFLPCDGTAALKTDTMRLQVSKDTLFRTRRSSFLPDDTLTVRFQYETISERGNFLVQSVIGVKRKCFLWTMKNFIEDQPTKDFNAVAENTDPFGILSMAIKSRGGINSDELFYFEIYLNDGGKCYCVLEVSVLDINGVAVNCVNGEFNFEAGASEQKRDLPPIIKKSKLLECRERLMPEGTLSLKCNSAITRGLITEENAVLSYYDDITPLLKESADISKIFKERSSSDSNTDIKSDLKKIMDNETFSDVILQVCSEEFHVHTNILAARSPVFESMFMSDMDGNKDNTFVIEDVDVDTMDRLILYMYTDTIDDSNWKNIKKLYSAAKNYEVQSLKQKCSSILKSKLSISNICDVLALAEDEDLKAAALDFISKHNSEVFASKEWKDFEKNNSSLVIQTLCKICSQKCLD